MAASESKESKCSSTLAKYGIKPFTKCNLLHYYAPLYGIASYGVLSVNVMNPGLMSKVFPKKDVTNVLLFSSVAGTCLYISNRELLKSAPKQKQFMYSAYGSLLFTFGSLLMWALLRSVLPDNKPLATVVGIASGVTLTAVGKEFFDFADSKVTSAASAKK